VKYIE